MINVSAKQLRKAASIQDKIERLQAVVNNLLGGSNNGSSTPEAPVKRQYRKRRKMSDEAKAKIAKAAKLRWAKARKAGKNSL